MSSSPIPTALQTPDVGATYQAAYDALGRAYWDASDLESKDLVHGAMEALGEIITAINQKDLAHNTQLFDQLKPQIDGANLALAQIKSQINQITKNISTAAIVIASVSKVLSLFSMV